MGYAHVDPAVLVQVGFLLRHFEADKKQGKKMLGAGAAWLGSSKVRDNNF